MSASLAQVAAPRADCSASAAHLGVKTDGVDEMPESTTLDDTTSPPSQIVPSIARAVPLTEEQKRANHIMSEQRRRTAIKAAYDELCVAVPALRAAIREYDERLSKVAGSQRTVSTASGNNNAAGIAGVLTGGIEVGGEKIDGRAGPKSEAVVLAKSKRHLRSSVHNMDRSEGRLQLLIICVLCLTTAKPSSTACHRFNAVVALSTMLYQYGIRSGRLDASES